MKSDNVFSSIDDTSLIEEILNIIPSLKIELVNRTELEVLSNQLVKVYHYLGHNKTIGPPVK